MRTQFGVQFLELLTLQNTHVNLEHDIPSQKSGSKITLFIKQNQRDIGYDFLGHHVLYKVRDLSG